MHPGSIQLTRSSFFYVSLVLRTMLIPAEKKIRPSMAEVKITFRL